MATRAPKHTHTMRIISHYDDFSVILLMCKECPRTENIKPGRVTIGESIINGRLRRKFRDETPQEYRERWGALPHLCCNDQRQEPHHPSDRN